MTKPRPIPREYFRVLADRCPLETWKQIVDTAVAQALDGNATARAWLAKQVLPDGMTLMDLAKMEYMGTSAEESIESYKGPIIQVRNK